MVGVGFGARVGPLNAGAGVNVNLPSVGGLFNFVGGGINAGLDAGAGLAAGLGGGINGGAGCDTCQAGGGAGGGIGLGINGGVGGSGGGGAGIGAGVNGGGDTGGGAGAGISAGINGGGGDTGAGASVGAGLGAGGQAGASPGAEGNESSPIGAGAGAGAGVGFGGGYGVSLVPVPVVPISVSAGLGGGAGGVGAGASVGALPNGSPQCTVQGGPARMIYFPPTGGQAAAGAENQPPGAPAPVGGSAITTLGQTFQPGSAYISCETLWAGYTNDQGSVVQTGPTFTNAIFPVPSDQISTQCQSTLTAAESALNTQAWGAPQQCDFNNVGASPSTCLHVAPPPNLLNQVPDFAPYLFWNISFQPPQYFSQENSPAPSQGSAWGGPPPECGCTPSVVQPTTNVVPTTPVATPTPQGTAPVPTTGPTQTPAATENSPTFTSSGPGGINGTSPTGPAPYTGQATKAGKSSFAVAALLVLSVLAF